MSQDGSYLFDPSAFWTDEDVEWMTYQQVGMYKRLMWHQWQNGSIPTDPSKLARLLCRGPEVFDRTSIAPLLGPLIAPFDQVPGEPGRMRQKRLHETREEWRFVRERNRESGKKGAEKRWGKRKASTDGPAMAPLDSGPNGGVHSKGREGKGREDKNRRTRGEEEHSDLLARAPIDSLRPPDPVVKPHAQREKLRKIEQLFESLEVQPPMTPKGKFNGGVVGRWLKQCGGDVDLLVEILDELHARGKLQTPWGYTWTMVQEWSVTGVVKTNGAGIRDPPVAKQPVEDHLWGITKKMAYPDGLAEDAPTKEEAARRHAYARKLYMEAERGILA